MKRPWLIVAAWVVLLIPTLLIGIGSLYLLRHEQERIADSAAAAAVQQARVVVETVDLAVTEVKEGLLDALARLPEADDLPDRLEEWRQTNPLIRNVFIWEPNRGLVLPKPARPTSDEETSFVRRYSALFEGRAAWGPPEPDRMPRRESDSAASQYAGRRELRALTQRQTPAVPELSSESTSVGPIAGSGWIPWFWENRLHWLGWVEPEAGGPRYGVEVEMMALLARLLTLLPSPPPGEAYALLDDGGRVFHQTGAAAIAADTRALATVPAGASLPHWQVSVYASDGAGEPGQGFLLISTLLVGSFVAAILFGGSLLLWQAYRNLVDARRKTTFVSNVSHELKTPLTTIRMYAELLSEGRVQAEEKRHHYLNVIVSESQRLTRLVNNVLDFSRLEQGRKTYARERLDLVAALHEVLDTHRERMRNVGMRLDLEVPEGPLFVHTDRDALEQALLNLLDNAIKYGGEGGEVSVKVEGGGDACRILVMDRGSGIPPAHRKRIFEKFHRVDDSLTARQPGSGLGLAIARQLLRDLGGDLTYSEREGGGACFAITVPWDEEVAP